MVDLTCFPYNLLFFCVFVCLFIHVYFSIAVKPTISEAELATMDVQPYMSNKQHQLTCTAYAFPLPDVTWFWQPCHRDPNYTEWVTMSKIKMFVMSMMWWHNMEQHNLILNRFIARSSYVFCIVCVDALSYQCYCKLRTADQCIVAPFFQFE